ncbi:hypothetical protein APR12_004943 [Nocardia amikacinitolerans]|uniref:hypothetical protein n=1 Tax=Nocardia amikacinitolerans TaxID=756689 RepID=UPI00082BD3C2|nr:hypothetical protein [Nocardia amikacinitolerans]MCP2319574.1 hypothetical protein [Nocardia amikacinitolerans]
MNTYSEIEIGVLTDIIESVDRTLDERIALGFELAFPRSKIYAVVIHAVMASAREAGHFGPGSIVRAPLLDVILDGAESSEWDERIYAVLMDFYALN